MAWSWSLTTWRTLSQTVPAGRFDDPMLCRAHRPETSHTSTVTQHVKLHTELCGSHMNSVCQISLVKAALIRTCAVSRCWAWKTDLAQGILSNCCGGSAAVGLITKSWGVLCFAKNCSAPMAVFSSHWYLCTGVFCTTFVNCFWAHLSEWEFSNLKFATSLILLFLSS